MRPFFVILDLGFGVGHGLKPARQAAGLDPIAALRGVGERGRGEVFLQKPFDSRACSWQCIFSVAGSHRERNGPDPEALLEKAL